jgi:hypothetical protein
MRRRHASGSVLLGLGLLLAALSCDDERDAATLDPLTPGDDPVAGTTCVPGQTRACAGACPESTAGYQVCDDEGRSYGACVCTPGSVITSDRFDIDRRAVGDSRLLPGFSRDDDLPLNTPGGQPLQGSANIGAACSSNEDCVSGLFCFDVGDGLSIGGPGGGYCTRPCASAAECEQRDAGSTCGTLFGQTLCIRLCEAGPLEDGEVKCLGREDVTCSSLTALGSQPPADTPNLGICTPRCQSDEGCGGQRCDLATGLCTIFPARGGLPLGAACTAAAQCEAGICFAASPQTERVCTAFCTLGAPGCGFDGNEPSVDVGCVLPQVPGEASGDRGLCLELCDTAADCQAENATCVPGAQDGRAGVCVKQVGAGEPPPPPPDPSDLENIGGACEDDDDCGGNLFCVTSSDDPFRFPGGPARGMCTMACEGNAECPGGGVCVNSSGESGLCLRACALGGGDTCGGRADLACASIGGNGACVPNCTSDDGCGDRVCSAGLCIDAPEPECQLDTDCPGGQLCDLTNGTCVPAPDPDCTSDSDCDDAEICDLESGDCVAAPPPPCASDADCASGLACDVPSGSCVTPPPAACTGDADCAPGLLCDLIIGECFAPEPEPCLSNAECPGQVCNPSSGECIAAPAIPIGGACTDDAQCAAEFCPTLGGASFCSGICLLGSPIGCEPYGADAFCLIPVQDDIGACLELCNTPADCAQPGWLCEPLTGAINGNTGACLPPPPAPAAPAP